MKTIITLFILCLSFTSAVSQDKNAQAIIDVNGVCSMCKDRIEKVAIRIKGVKSAVWSSETLELKLIYDNRKTSIDSISKEIAAAGHDTKRYTATDTQYSTLAPCCKYRDTSVKAHHKNK